MWRSYCEYVRLDVQLHRQQESDGHNAVDLLEAVGHAERETLFPYKAKLVTWQWECVVKGKFTHKGETAAISAPYEMTDN